MPPSINRLPAGMSGARVVSGQGSHSPAQGKLGEGRGVPSGESQLETNPLLRKVESFFEDHFATVIIY